jgi:uncharacterized membrane protein YcgQ (UPF0703/DUF1980 family)
MTELGGKVLAYFNALSRSLHGVTQKYYGGKKITHTHTHTHTQYSPCLTQIRNAHIPITKTKATSLKVTCSVKLAKLPQFLPQNKLLDINLDIEAVQCLSEDRQTGATITRKYEQCIGPVSVRINLISGVTILLGSLAEP